MNTALSVDEKLAEAARKVAQSMGKSSNQLVRDCLERLAHLGQVDDEIAELHRLGIDGPGRLSALGIQPRRTA